MSKSIRTKPVIETNTDTDETILGSPELPYISNERYFDSSSNSTGIEKVRMRKCNLCGTEGHHAKKCITKG